MKRVVATVVLGATLVLACTGCGGSSSAFGRYDILLLGHDPDAARLFLWRPGSPVKPITGPQIWGTSGGGDFFSGMTDGYWSPDGSLIAYEQDTPGGLAPPSPSVLVMRPDGTHVKEVASGDYDADSGAGVPSWSPNGRQLVWEHDTVINADQETEQDFAIDDVPSGAERILPANRATSDPVWGKPGIAYTSGAGVMLLDPATGRSRLVLRGVSSSALAWSPRGVLALEEPTQIVLVTPSGRVVRKLAVPRAARDECGISWSPDGKQIFASTQKAGSELARLWVDTVSTGRWEELPPVPSWRNYAYSCAVSWR